MGWNIALPILIFALGGLLVSAGIQDARTREIANWKNAAIAMLAPLWWYANGLGLWPDMALQVGVALAVFALFLVAFHFGMMGGGDVKLIVALALWLPFPAFLSMLMVMSIAGGLVTVVMMIERSIKSNSGQIEVPYGVAIAIAGLLALREPLLNQFPS
ncbi:MULTISPECIES: prepilin peptidase [unclassified Sphingomonas]|uniref:A24 family peptidase n=1 Tax=unclassified Sphingomonas TaxID=196159 RepID=UPI0006FD3A44|nr:MULTISPECIES: prepilin peptidase [unclassified Sphingomonas]KQN29419.1 peptidase [Sphingomonas sp. Leaf38]KQN31390.1 peptidase [Sphingomonas sp. Leaf34]